MGVEPKCLVLLVDHPARNGAFKVVSVYLSEQPIEAIMETMRDAGMNVAETFDPVKPWGNGIECQWDETEAIIADDMLPSMVYTVTAPSGAFVRQFRAVALPLIGGDNNLRSIDFVNHFLPEWAR